MLVAVSQQATSSQAPATTPTTVPVPPVPPMPTSPGAATGVDLRNVAGDPVQNALDATANSAAATQNVFRDVRNVLRDDIRDGLREGLRGGSGLQGTTAGTIEVPRGPQSDIPPEVIPIVGIVFGSVLLMVIFVPIIRAVTRAFERRADRSVLPAAQVSAQLRELQSSLDTMAIEVERISEAQRFQAKLLAERAERVALPAEGRGGA